MWSKPDTDELVMSFICFGGGLMAVGVAALSVFTEAPVQVDGGFYLVIGTFGILFGWVFFRGYTDQVDALYEKKCEYQQKWNDADDMLEAYKGFADLVGTARDTAEVAYNRKGDLPDHYNSWEHDVDEEIEMVVIND